MFNFDRVQRQVECDGFAICDPVLSVDAVAELLGALAVIDGVGSVRRRGTVFAIRNLLDLSPEVRKLAASETIRDLVQPILGARFFPVRAILFDKVPDANWKVPWHQDVTIAVQERVEAEGFGPWTWKADVLHVQPPVSVLEQMLSVRVHLDLCNEKNGALRVIPGSHLRGRIPEEQISFHVGEAGQQVCPVGVGGALLMRPLLLHASSPSQVAVHRRVVHIDFAAVELPAGLRWFSEKLRSNCFYSCDSAGVEKTS